MNLLKMPKFSESVISFCCFKLLYVEKKRTLEHNIVLYSIPNQIQEYSKSGIACFLKEDDGSWDPQDDDSMNSPCWQLKWKLRQFVRKVGNHSRHTRSEEKESSRSV